MADLGWNPKACLLGIGKNCAEIFRIVQHEWAGLIKFYSRYRGQHPDDFYDLSDSPTLDFFYIEEESENPKFIDTSRYHIVFIVGIDNGGSSLPSGRVILLNEPHLSILIRDDTADRERCQKGQTIAVIQKEGFYNTASEFVIDLIRFFMFPRYVSSDFTDFKLIKDKVIDVIHFKSLTERYEDEFRTFYKKNVCSENDTAAIFYFRNCENTKIYSDALVDLGITIYSDHCSSLVDNEVKVLILSAQDES